MEQKHPVKFVYSGIPLRRFSVLEFRGYNLAPELLVKLDLLAVRWRDETQKGISVSTDSGAIGREDRGKSQHCFGTYFEVRAIDIFPHITTLAEAIRFSELSVECGFTGIGVYPEASPSVMFHLDVRRDRDPLNPADWGAKRSTDKKNSWEYISFDAALELLPVR